MNAPVQPFNTRVRSALGNPTLQRSLDYLQTRFITLRAAAVANLPEFQEVRSHARGIKDHTLAHLDLYLAEYERKVIASGGHVHWAEDAAAARQIVLDLCRKAGARTVTKGKSMVTEEIGLGHFLEKHGVQPIETDLGEYIVQLRGETPSHIVAPALHVTKEEVAADFRHHHGSRDAERDLTEPATLVAEAREELRARFLAADVGITGANFLVAETGSSVIVTNEGNGDLTQTLPRMHIVVASIEKVIPTLNDALQVIRLLARSTNGQDITVYNSIVTGPRRPEDSDGPEEYHVVLVDNGRSNMLGSDYREALRCIRCGACMNHCPVYQAIGGHAYAAVYPGPIGAVLTPGLTGIEAAKDLPNASTFCGRCESVCPMQIPLPRLMRHWREEEFSRHLTPAAARWGLGGWRWLATHPRLYRLTTSLISRFGRLFAPAGGYRDLALGGDWTAHRDMPAPEGGTFQARWANRR